MNHTTPQFFVKGEDYPKEGFDIDMQMSTANSWNQRVDERNRPLNADPNTYTIHYTNKETGKKYVKQIKGWVTEYYEMDVFFGKTDGVDERRIPFMTLDDTPSYIRDPENKIMKKLSNLS